MYKNKEKRQTYIKQWRAKRVASGYYGYCEDCKNPLGRTEGYERKTNLCISCNKGEKHVHWKGGYINHDGYVVIQTGKGRGNRKPRLQHRVVMEKHLGRELLTDETVHHINGIRTDNRIENLELWSGFQPRGQRVKDKVAWAKEILRRYDA